VFICLLRGHKIASVGKNEKVVFAPKTPNFIPKSIKVQKLPVYIVNENAFLMLKIIKSDFQEKRKGYIL
jgi:hypothetical protein